MSKRPSHSAGPGGSGSKKRHKDDELHPVPLPLQYEEEEFDFETILEKKKRTVRVMRMAQEMLEIILSDIDNLVKPVKYTEFFIFLVKLYTALSSVARRGKIHMGLDIVAGVANKADLDTLREGLFINIQLIKRFKMKGMELSCPKFHDDLFVHWDSHRPTLGRLHEKALCRRV